MFSNGETVVITKGKYAGLTGIIGATDEDGRNEVLFPDSDLEVLLPDSALRYPTE
jgi:hypothetical protein